MPKYLYAPVDYRTESSELDKSLKGYTLPELMIGVMILGIVLSTSFGGMQQGMKILELARDNTRAAQIVQHEMEALRSQNWDSISALEAEAAFEPNIGYLANFTTSYLCERLIEESKDGQKKVLVGVVWSDSRGHEHTFKTSMLFTKGGLNDFYYRTFGE